jgi:F-type H+-transporting ATPase subunit gamma
MASLRQIRQRLKSVQGTKQIMRAMQLVSASKLKRAQGKLLQARVVLEFLDGLLDRVLAAAPSQEHPLTAKLAGGESWLVLFTSDAGLCGSYNTNLIQMAEAFLRRDTAHRTRLITIGKKGHRYFAKRGYAVAGSYLELAGRPDLTKAGAIGRELMEHFLSGRVAGIQVLYARFLSSATFRPTIVPWLPIQLSQSPSHPVTQSPTAEYIFEPAVERVFEDLLPRWAVATFQWVLLEAFTSEHSARMLAMKQATDNAEELLKTLTRQRNRIRQAAITKELSEIVGTAEALK